MASKIRLYTFSVLLHRSDYILSVFCFIDQTIQFDHIQAPPHHDFIALFDFKVLLGNGNEYDRSF